MIYICLTICVLILIYRLSTKNHDYWKKRDIPFMKPYPIFGTQTRQYLGLASPVDETVRAYKFHPKEKLIGLYMFNRPLLLIKDPELIKQITVKKFEHFTDHTPLTIHPDVDPMFARNLFSLNGSDWKDMRSTITPAFTSSKIRMMFDLVSQCGEQMVVFLKQKCPEDGKLLHAEMDDIFSHFSNDVIATVAFGISVDTFKDNENEFYKMGNELTNLSLLRSVLLAFSPWIMKMLGEGFTSKRIKNYFRNLIYGNIKTREEKGIIRPDIIHMLMQARKGTMEADMKNIPDAGYATAFEANLLVGRKTNLELTNDDIVAQGILFFFAGFKTSTGLMIFTAYELALNDDVQKILQKEIDEALIQTNGKITYDVMFRMKYLDMVISETLRKWPPGFDHDRICTNTVTLTTPEKNYTVEKGVSILLPTYALHRDPKYFPNPEKFDPERFNDINKDSIEKFAYLPFGIGPRACVGSRIALMETKLAIFHLLANFDLHVTEKTDIPMTLKKNAFHLLPENGAWIGLTIRKK